MCHVSKLDVVDLHVAFAIACAPPYHDRSHGACGARTFDLGLVPAARGRGPPAGSVQSCDIFVSGSASRSDSVVCFVRGGGGRGKGIAHVARL